MWEESLRLPIEARPRHVSVYDLRVNKAQNLEYWTHQGSFLCHAKRSLLSL
ncbi:hypothetical protein NC651_034039 [Populus alba x Populus x berolinensis]|nr:hypothetical protein NC651_034039 [Populus alba x Populus x berolinensis]